MTAFALLATIVILTCYELLDSTRLAKWVMGVQLSRVQRQL